MTDSPEIVDDLALQALVERVQQARAVRGTLCIRGGDTKAFYGDGPRGEPLDMGMLCGIGFTMSLFVSSLAFAQQPLEFTESVLGVLGGSLVAAVLGMLWLSWTLPKTPTVARP